MQIFQNLKAKIFSLMRPIKLSNDDKIFVKFSKESWDNIKKIKGKSEILIDALDYEEYIFLSSYVINYFSTKFNLTKRYVYYTHTNSILRIIKIICYSTFSMLFRIDKLYKSFGCYLGLIYKRDQIFKPININNLDLKTKFDVLALKIDEISIGDLVYDSYLRTYSVPTVDIKDKRFLNLVKDAYRIYYSCINYLNSHNVKIIILSHACYIQYGILARIAVARDIDTYSFSKWTSRIVYKLSNEHYLLTGKHLHYREAFNQLENKEERLQNAREIINARLQGTLDNGVSYMKHSVYAKNSISSERIFLQNGKPKVIMFLHCFFDSPHIYRDMIFADFYDWVFHTLNIINDLSYDFVVKPHPNGLPGNENIISIIKSEFPNVRFIDKNISNRQIINEKVTAAITVYGTVGYEFAYQGIPVLTSGDNPYSAYDFCYQAKNINEYDFHLRNIEKLPVKISQREIESFFYMHYLHPDDGRIEGNNNIFGLTRELNNPEIFNEMVNSAKKGVYDSAFEKIELALKTVY